MVETDGPEPGQVVEVLVQVWLCHCVRHNTVNVIPPLIAYVSHFFSLYRAILYNFRGLIGEVSLFFSLYATLKCLLV